MHWGSFDPFTIDSAFWQDRMGMPVANKEFLIALLTHGSAESYTFFCPDSAHVVRFRENLQKLAPAACRSRIQVVPQAMALQHLARSPADVMHNGDFTFYMPSLIEMRNRRKDIRPFGITGVTHSLDTASLHEKFLSLLLAGPGPCDAVICTSQCAVEMVRKTFSHFRESLRETCGAKLPEPPQLVKIPLGLPREAYRQEDKAACRARLQLREDHVVLLSLARFSPRTKMDLSPLLEALAFLASAPQGLDAMPPYTLVLAGAGKSPDLELVKNLVDRLGLGSHVRILPNIPREEKYQLYGAADIFLSLVDNYQETFGITLLEAMAQGLPILATDFSGYRELVSQERTGFLIPTTASPTMEPWDSLMGLLDHSVLRFYRAQKVAFDLETLLKKLVLLARDTNLRMLMGERARAQAMAYRWDGLIPAYESLWSGLSAQARLSVGKAPSPPPMAKQLLHPPAHIKFSHYPSRVASRLDKIRLSPYGAQCLQHNLLPTHYEEMSQWLHTECMGWLIQKTHAQECERGSLIREAATTWNLSEDVVQFHLDALMKHGFLKIPQSGKK